LRSGGPILLVESTCVDASSCSGQVEDACRHVRFAVSQQLGLRTVGCHSPPSAFGFFTPSDVASARDLAARTGAGSSTIVAVGSGTAMDLAKALAADAATAASEFSRTNHYADLVLVPATYGATMVAAASHALWVDPSQPAILPAVPPSAADVDPAATRPIPVGNTTIIPLLCDPKHRNLVDPERRIDAVLAAISVSLDSLLRQEDRGQPSRESEARLGRLLRHLIAATTTTDDNDCPLSEILVEVGARYWSYGLRTGSDDDDAQDRSIPLALATSLLPEVFPEHSALSVMASYAPAMYRLVLEKRPQVVQNEIVREDLERLLLQEAPKIVSTEPLEVLWEHVQSNQILWNCSDAPPDLLREALRDHVLVDQR